MESAAALEKTYGFAHEKLVEYMNTMIIGRLDNTYLLKGCACALKYVNEEDPQAVELQKVIAENGVEAAIVKYIGLKPEDRMTKVIIREYENI